MHLPQTSAHERRWARTSLIDHVPRVGGLCSRARRKPAVRPAMASGCCLSCVRTWSIVGGRSYPVIASTGIPHNTRYIAEVCYHVGRWFEFGAPLKRVSRPDRRQRIRYSGTRISVWPRSRTRRESRSTPSTAKARHQSVQRGGCQATTLGRRHDAIGRDGEVSRHHGEIRRDQSGQCGRYLGPSGPDSTT
jgi:hypothetical protein